MKKSDEFLFSFGFEIVEYVFELFMNFLNGHPEKKYSQLKLVFYRTTVPDYFMPVLL